MRDRSRCWTVRADTTTATPRPPSVTCVTKRQNRRENRVRSSVCASVLLSLTRDARTATAPAVVVTFPLLVIAVSDHQPVTCLIDLVDVSVDVGGGLGLQRRRQHLRASARTISLSNDPPAGPLPLEPLHLDYLEHGRTFLNQRSNAGPDQSGVTSRSSIGKVRALPAGHPQVLIIAPDRPASGSTGGRWTACSTCWQRMTHPAGSEPPELDNTTWLASAIETW